VAAAAAHAAFGLYCIARGWLWPLGPVMNPQGSAGLAAVCIAIAALVVVAFPPKLWAAQKTVIAFACAAALAFPVIDVVGQVAAHRLADEISQPLPFVHPPGEKVVCPRNATINCARRAASIAGHPMAWTPLPPDWDAKVELFTHPVADAVEVGYSGLKVLILNSGVQRTSAFGEPGRRVERDGIRILVATSVHGVSATWTRGGTRYAVRSQWGRRPPDASHRLLDVWRTIRYVKPVGTG
jgi:hypothetical protein